MIAPKFGNFMINKPVIDCLVKGLFISLSHNAKLSWRTRITAFTDKLDYLLVASLYVQNSGLSNAKFHSNGRLRSTRVYSSKFQGFFPGIE